MNKNGGSAKVPPRRLPGSVPSHTRGNFSQLACSGGVMFATRFPAALPGSNLFSRLYFVKCDFVHSQKPGRSYRPALATRLRWDELVDRPDKRLAR